MCLDSNSTDPPAARGSLIRVNITQLLQCVAGSLRGYEAQISSAQLQSHFHIFSLVYRVRSLSPIGHVSQTRDPIICEISALAE